MEPDFETSLETIGQALDEIEHTLDQMLALARLSASDLNVDRASLQNTFKHLQLFTTIRTKPSFTISLCHSDVGMNTMLQL